MKQVKQCVVLVDSHKPRRHNTAGRYIVAAKTPAEAEQLVRDVIGFGSVKFYYFDESGKYNLPYKTVKKQNENGLVDPHHANDTGYAM